MLRGKSSSENPRSKYRKTLEKEEQIKPVHFPIVLVFSSSSPPPSSPALPSLPPHTQHPPQQTQTDNLVFTLPHLSPCSDNHLERKGSGELFYKNGITLYLLPSKVLFLPHSTSCLFLHVNQLRTNSFFSNCLLYHRMHGPQTIQPPILPSTGIQDAISFLPPHRCHKYSWTSFPESSEFPEQSLDSGNPHTLGLKFSNILPAT